MSEDVDEVVTIAIMSSGDESIRTVTNEYECTDTCWPHLVQVFLEQLQGLGYVFATTPDEMANVLDKYNQDIVCAECGGCDEVEETPVEEEKKYPYTGVLKNKAGITVVRFTGDSRGMCVYTDGHEGTFIGQTSGMWEESMFERVSK